MTVEEIHEIANEIAEKLGETESNPIRQLRLIVELCGADFAKEVLDETLKIEADGGMKTQDEERRRTPGGVYFYLCKGKLTPELRTRIFPGFGENQRGKVMSWLERLEHVKPLLEDAEKETGEVSFARIKIQGRIGHVEVFDDSVMMVMDYPLKQVPYPRGVPQPPFESLRYMVYMGEKAWTRIKEQLEKSPKDVVIIDGICVFDQELGVIGVLTMGATTKELDRRRQLRQAARAANQAEDDENSEKSEKPDKSDKSEKKDKKDPQAKKDKKEKKQPKESKPAGKSKPAPNAAAKKPAAPEISLPEGIPESAAAKLRQLHSAAATLRQRISDMEAKGQQAGIDMTRKLLRNTEKQIEAITKQYK